MDLSPLTKLGGKFKSFVYSSLYSPQGRRNNETNSLDKQTEKKRKLN